MANEQNLVSLGERTTSEQREIAAMGGIKSGITRRRRMALRELVSILTNAQASLEPEQIQHYAAIGLDAEDVTVQLQMVQAQIAKAIEGDTKAFEVLRDTVGEKPKDSMALSHEVTGETKIRLWFPSDDGN